MKESGELASSPMANDDEEEIEPMDQETDSPGEARAPAPRHDVEWDAREMGCGELVLELRLRLQSIGPGQVLKVTARDLGAPKDLPAWCRLTGHALVSFHPPIYWIQRKEC